MCYEHGGMIDDGTLFRLSPENFRWIGGDDQSGIWLKEQAKKLGLKVWIKSATDQLHNVGVQGPKSREILREIVLDGADAADAGRTRLVSLHHRPHRRFWGHPDRRLAHGLHRRTRL